MAAGRPHVIVTGATGKQGGALIQALLTKPSQPFDIFAVTRNPDSNGAKALADKPNIKVIKGEFDEPEAIFAQVPQPWGVFSVTAPVMGKRDAALDEERQGKAMIDAAVKAGVKHIVYNSVDRGFDSDNKETSIPHFRSKKHIEDHLKAETAKSGTTWTIVRPVAFMESLTNDFVGKVFVSMWRQNGMDTKLQLVGTRDIGRVSAEALLNADKAEYKNKSISLAGDEISPAEAAQIFKKVTGEDIPSTFGFFGTLSKWMMPNELGEMFKFFKDDGYTADIFTLRNKYPFLRTFDTWLAEESAWKHMK